MYPCLIKDKETLTPFLPRRRIIMNIQIFILGRTFHVLKRYEHILETRNETLLSGLHWLMKGIKGLNVVCNNRCDNLQDPNSESNSNVDLI